MIKPKKLKRGDTIAIVSLSWGGLGDEVLLHKYDLGKKRLEEEFGLHVIAMPHALKGSKFVYEHPELRAKDLMDAFLDPKIDAILCAIGGDDTIRLLPYIDYDIIAKHPKIFMGFSDTTANHLMMYKAGIVSYYGPCLMCDFAEYGSMFDYTKEYVKKTLFDAITPLEITSSPYWTDETIPWKIENIEKQKRLLKEKHGYELLAGQGVIQGHLIGGCLDAFTLYNGTSIWPTIKEVTGCILFLETSEEYPSPDVLTWQLRNLAAQGFFDVIHGIVFGKPMDEKFYEEYKEVLHSVIGIEANHPELPILYNLNFGHSTPRCILPYGIKAEINCETKSFRLLESAVQDDE